MALVRVREYETARDMLATYGKIRSQLFQPITDPVAPEPKPEQEPPSTPPEPVAPPPVYVSPPLQIFTIHQIRDEVAAVFGLSIPELMSVRRFGYLVFARHTIFALAKRFTSYSYPMIGRFIGGRDHTTVLSGVHKMAALMNELELIMPPDAGLTEWVAAIKDRAPVFEHRNKR
jgi:hypothetical protein